MALPILRYQQDPKNKIALRSRVAETSVAEKYHLVVHQQMKQTTNRKTKIWEIGKLFLCFFF